ncbi:MAG: insulinase family protein [Blastocatellia bacterium]|nr:insulinase family protein [Blastocatellia bacterium]MCS7156848.1 insulinase family protein [Blastocatellia bacterium]MCX7752806.1 insulinase family protein [Blastocatellia bacterium]MDW8167540.1 pitrilysin family protein [Acidobacteriota bacterium]MDW8256141.1 pitrilysin family protein [Acidobacteriota bacterium]
MRRIRKTVTASGLTVVSERMDHLRSVSLGIWVRAGSRHEPMEQSGITHFIEHLVFKGTERRSTRQIAEESDWLGGTLDAFTSHECAAYSAKILDEHLPRAFDLLADLVTAPRFDAQEIEKERQVILEEMRLVEDTPDDLATELFLRNFWPQHRLGRPILGTEETLFQLTREVILQYFQQLYTPPNLIVSAAGQVEHEHLVELAARYFDHIPDSGMRPRDTTPWPSPQIVLHEKEQLSETQILLGAQCPGLRSRDRHAVLLLSSILGGGTSSRLFQTIREDHGLAYATSAGTMLFSDTGLLLIHAATSPKNVLRVLDLIVAELRRLKREPVPAEELQRAKEQAKAATMLSLESSSARMAHIAQQEIYFGHQTTYDQILKSIEAVSTSDVQRLAQEIFQTEALALVLLGRLDSVRVDRERLAC